MRAPAAINIAELRELARRRVARIAFDYLEGGCDDEECLERNQAAFHAYRLLPRYLVDVSTRDRSVTLLGRTYAGPIGVAPTGIAGFFRRGGDILIARAAVRCDVPFILSGTSNASIETIAEIAPAHAWYQLYAARDRRISEDMIRRAQDAGIATLVLSADAPVRSNRERNIRNAWPSPLGRNTRIVLEALAHPGWLIDYVRGRHELRLDNWAPYSPSPEKVAVGHFFFEQTPFPGLTWRELEGFRRLWRGNLVVKGILHPADAVRAADGGADGIIVSNHGGRQLDRAPAPIDVLPAIRAAVGRRLAVMVDSGVRRGADVAIALCLGADYVFVGRAVLYGAAAAGYAGAVRALTLLNEELDLVMGQIGCPSVTMLGRDFLFETD